MQRIPRELRTPKPSIRKLGDAAIADSPRSMRERSATEVGAHETEVIRGITTDRDLVVRRVAAARDPNSALGRISASPATR